MSALRAQATVSVTAIERNCERLGRELHAGTMLCAVVKADGYGRWRELAGGCYGSRGARAA
jgi:alanine racemase